MATATLQALRQGYPDSHITWAVGTWSKAVIISHPMLDDVVDTGPLANPTRTLKGLWSFVRLLRAGHYDIMISLVRSPFMSAAAQLSGIPLRAGLDSAGRGFGYTHRVSIDPAQPRAEGAVYLDVPRALGLSTEGCFANIPVLPQEIQSVSELLKHHQIEQPFFLVNPAGGNNPGMVMDAKRWPAQNFAALINRLQGELRLTPILLAGPKDADIVQQVQSSLMNPTVAFIGTLSFGEIGALASLSRLYVGNDTGLTHLAAAAGARTAVVFGPSDPVRYTPFVPDTLALWKTRPLHNRGVAEGLPVDWNWARDGIGVETVAARILEWIGT